MARGCILFREDELKAYVQGKIRFVTFRVRFASGNKNFIQKKREKVFLNLEEISDHPIKVILNSYLILNNLVWLSTRVLVQDLQA